MVPHARVESRVRVSAQGLAARRPWNARGADRSYNKPINTPVTRRVEGGRGDQRHRDESTPALAVIHKMPGTRSER